MNPHYEDAGLRLWHGSNKDILPTFDDESFDSIVTDPPYELGFMGKGWDSTGIAYDVDVWRECLRVLKPGGHLLAFGGTRTWHRIAVAIEDAGFEIRDSIAWLYGSGFPKSMNVAKAIASGTGRPEDIRRLNMGDAYKPSGRGRVNYDNGGGSKMNGQPLVDVDLPDVAQQWEGWGTALKPAFEPIIVARKPLRGTVAANVLAHGTGALNIDATRVAYQSPADKASAVPQGTATALNGALAGKAQKWESATTSQTARSTTASTTVTPANQKSTERAETADGTARSAFTPNQSDLGRFPANVLLEQSQAEALDEQSGVLKSGMMRAGTAKAGKAAGILGEFKPQPSLNDTYGDSGGASRFFPTFRYEAKAPTSERPNVDGTVHATVKPLDLMRWLVRLVTRPGGRVLDLYAGSGTTGEAALLEGMEVDLIELEAEHLPLILARVRKPLHPAMFGDWEDAS